MATVSENLTKALAASMRNEIDKAFIKSMAKDMDSPVYEVIRERSFERNEDVYAIVDISDDKRRVVATNLNAEEFKALHKLLDNDAYVLTPPELGESK